MTDKEPVFRKKNIEIAEQLKSLSPLAGYDTYHVGLVDTKRAKSHCVKWHYSNIFPPHCIISLGYEDEKGLAGVALWGWGVRPRHTIQKIWPELTTKDYWELNRLCLRDDCPKNSESWFIGQCVKWMKQNQPERKVLLSWADGVRGKPGYVYQASNWYYGGFITTEIYLTKDGEPVHPRLMITRYGTRSMKKASELGLKKVWGKQFLYMIPLCTKKEQRELLKSSEKEWTKNYPKNDDMVWKIQAGEVSRETHDVPNIKRSGRFRQPAQTLFDNV